AGGSPGRGGMRSAPTRAAPAPATVAPATGLRGCPPRAPWRQIYPGRREPNILREGGSRRSGERAGTMLSGWPDWLRGALGFIAGGVVGAVAAFFITGAIYRTHFPELRVPRSSDGTYEGCQRAVLTMGIALAATLL